MQFVPYLVAVVAAIWMLGLPRGKDLVVAVALIPWWAFEVELGVSVKVSELLMVISTVRHLIASPLRPSNLPGLGWILVYFALSILMAVCTIELGDAVPSFAGGGAMRNGYGRVLTILIKNAILFAFLIVAVDRTSRQSPYLLLKSYVYSCFTLSVLGLIQFGVFLGTGTDIFPIGLFDHSIDRSGSTLINGELLLRISSLGGEPKGFGQAVAIAVCILVVFKERFRLTKSWYRVLVGTMLVVTVLSSSTSAFLVLLTVSFFTFFFSRKPAPFTRLGTTIVLCSIGLAIFGAFFAFASITNIAAAPKYPKLNSFWESLVYKATNRIELDDTDAVIMESFVAEPERVCCGMGLGLVHHHAYKFVPTRMQHYLKGQIIVAKSGIALFFGDLGVVGLLIIALAWSAMIPQRGKNILSAPDLRLVMNFQALAFGLFAALLLRVYSAEVIWLVVASGPAIIRHLSKRNVGFSDQRRSAQARRVARHGLRAAA